MVKKTDAEVKPGDPDAEVIAEQNAVLENLYQHDEVDAHKNSLRALRERIIMLKATLATGNKSELDNVGLRLDELVADVDALLL